MLVIGVDPGTARTGYGLVSEDQDGNLKTVNFGVIHTNSELPLPNRLLSLYQKLIEIIFLHQPDSGAVEKLYFQRNVKSAMSVGHARGISMLALAQAGIEVVEYSPMEVKQAVTGYGNADKSQVQQMVCALLRLETIPKPDDAADALAVAICHLHSCQFH